MAVPTGSAQLGVHLVGVVAALVGDDDFAALQLREVERVLQRGFVLGLRGGLAARIGCGEEQGLDRKSVV